LPNAPLRGYAPSLDAPARFAVEAIVRNALLEDIGHGHDLTTDAIVPPDRQSRGSIVARKAGVLCGIDAATLAFRLLDPAIKVSAHVSDGASVRAGESIAEVTGSARAMLTGERTALNLLGHLCGVATLTRAMVDAISGTNAKITDTRKTTPGLRLLEKYAVRCGGGVNHRFGLDDAVLIKDNHRVLAGSIADAVAAVRSAIGHLVKVEIEVDTLEQLHQVLEAPVDAVLLDNMTPAQLRDAVRLIGGRVIAEASGGVTAANVLEIARTGVDVISIGALTHSAPALDIGLDFEA
jgi:nicotinate-nucleotide pyrophosphorylase (carboxylating)